MHKDDNGIRRSSNRVQAGRQRQIAADALLRNFERIISRDVEEVKQRLATTTPGSGVPKAGQLFKVLTITLRSAQEPLTTHGDFRLVDERVTRIKDNLRSWKRQYCLRQEQYIHQAYSKTGLPEAEPAEELAHNLIYYRHCCHMYLLQLRRSQLRPEFLREVKLWDPQRLEAEYKRRDEECRYLPYLMPAHHVDLFAATHVAIPDFCQPAARFYAETMYTLRSMIATADGNRKEHSSKGLVNKMVSRVRTEAALQRKCDQLKKHMPEAFHGHIVRAFRSAIEELREDE